jgi:hypothetical protein
MSRLFILGLLITNTVFGGPPVGADSCQCNTSANQSPLFLFTAGYRIPVNKGNILNSGHGLYFEGGLNAGKLISKRTVIGIYAGWAWRDIAWHTSFNEKFIADYTSSTATNEGRFSNTDSAIVATSSELIASKKGNSLGMPGCETNSFHNYSLYYGVVVKLPYRIIPALKVYTGTTRSHFRGNGYLLGGKTDYTIFELRRRMYGCEVVVFRGLPKSSHANLGALSLYYEVSNFYNGSLYVDDGNQTRTIAFRNFIHSSVLKKYSKEMAFGVKFAYTIF